MNNKLKEIILIITSFILGILVVIIIEKVIPSNVKYESSLSESISKVYDSVVLIQGYNGTSLTDTGTGFFYKKDNKYAYIITNEHVISNSSSIKIITSQDKEIKADVLGNDEYLDIAVLRVDKKYAKLIAPIGNSKKNKLGDTIFVVGSPLGYNYRGTVSKGIISGRDRIVTTTLSSQDEEWMMKVIQVDASINPGNSGGPLVNIDGQVIGIVSLKLVDNDIEGIGFAIPIEYVMNYVNYLEKNEKVKWPTLDLSIIDADNTSELLKYNIPINKEYKGVLVTKNSSKKTNLKAGDIITKIENNIIKDTSYFKYHLYQYKINDIIEITYIINGKERKTKVFLC